MSDVLSMSDEDFLNMNGPTSTEAGASSQEVTEPTPAAEQEETVEPTSEEAQTPAEATSTDAADGGILDPKDESGEQAPEQTEATVTEPAAAQPAKEGQGKESTESATPGSKEEAASSTTPDYEGFYKAVMAPLQANGKTIQLQNPQEAIQLMQMGANYTRKMQAIAPHRKVLMMLENSGMLDEGKLSFAIDLVNKNPEAIKKLIKDAGIDPLEIDTNTEPAYREGNHRVTDEEATFVSALEDLQSNPGGTETLTHINTQWDQASKEVLWKNPEVLQVIHQQRANGVYERIAAEVDRQRVLGMLPAEVPFIQAYKKIGDELAAAGAFNDIAQKQAPAAQVVKTPVAVSTLPPKQPVKPGANVSAAAAPRSTSKTAQVQVNPLAMSDDEFLKTMANRL